MRIQQLRANGFDRSRRTGTREYKVACSQCEALVVNGVPCHELRCPNIKGAR
jgi:hypothetical protein